MRESNNPYHDLKKFLALAIAAVAVVCCAMSMSGPPRIKAKKMQHIASQQLKPSAVIPVNTASNSAPDELKPKTNTK